MEGSSAEPPIMVPKSSAAFNINVDTLSSAWSYQAYTLGPSSDLIIEWTLGERRTSLNLRDLRIDLDSPHSFDDPEGLCTTLSTRTRRKFAVKLAAWFHFKWLVEGVWIPAVTLVGNVEDGPHVTNFACNFHRTGGNERLYRAGKQFLYQRSIFLLHVLEADEDDGHVVTILDELGQRSVVDSSLTTTTEWVTVMYESNGGR
ncbi:hypothetical protein K439DRAFT_1617219 [Ramaria rubella]|nr:hypothetical protein K439DRAFT_1617219 [Ramaria rubella]